MRKAAPWLALAIFLVVYLTTLPTYIGDTARYAAEVIEHSRGNKAQFWEFGHLLWRPWGGLGYSLFGALFARAFGDEPHQAVVRFFVITCFLCAALSVVLTARLLTKVAGAWVALGVSVAFVCSNALLNYSHAGAPYVPALLFTILSLSLSVAAVENPARGNRYAGLAGLAFAFACALWFPYSFVGLGLLAVLRFWPSAAGPAKGLRWKLAGRFMIVLAPVALVLFATGAVAEGVTNGPRFVQWIKEADNGMAQSKTAIRAVTGIARSIWDFGRETVLLKRWLFKDPYNPVQVSQVGLALGGKLASFYLGVAAALWIAWRERRPLSLIFLAASIPLLLFATTLFEPSSAERFLPVFPFACLVFAVALENAPRHRIPAACAALLLASAAFFNVTQNSAFSQRAGIEQTRQRIERLRKGVSPESLVALVTFEDEIYRLTMNRPLDRSFFLSSVRVTDAVMLASERTTLWRPMFAQAAFDQWKRGKQMWLSERLLAERPLASWQWVEGDDPRIRWAEIPEAFRRLATDAKLESDGDGFLRLADNEANRALLSEWVLLDPANGGAPSSSSQ